jgi:hypothetical protein
VPSRCCGSCGSRRQRAGRRCRMGCNWLRRWRVPRTGACWSTPSPSPSPSPNPSRYPNPNLNPNHRSALLDPSGKVRLAVVRLLLGLAPQLAGPDLSQKSGHDTQMPASVVLGRPSLHLSI